MNFRPTIKKILREELESKWNISNEYNYQDGYCHLFAYNIIDKLKKLYPSKNIRYYLILADLIYDYDEGEVEDSKIVHAYIKIDDLYLDSNGFSSENDIEKRTQDYYNNALIDLPDDYRVEIWHNEYDKIPKHFFTKVSCDNEKVKRDVDKFLSNSDVRELLNILN